MSVRNLIGLTTVTPTVSQVSLTSTSATQIITNAASSSTCAIVNSLYVCNTDSVAVTATVNVYSAAALGGTAYAIMSAVSIPANSTVNVCSTTGPIYLVENMSLGVTAGTSSELIVNAFYVVCS